MKLWLRNGLFLVVFLGFTGVVTGKILKRHPFPQPVAYRAGAAEEAGFRGVVERVDKEFRVAWERAGVVPVTPASDLALARRLSLALTGTVPSLEEIRAYEAAEPGNRVEWWLAHLFEDRRYSDYLAERFARVTVGVEDGPFIVYRRHRLVTWLGEQFHLNRPYDEVVRDLIAAEGIWTSKPQVNFITVTIDPNNDKEGPDEQKLAARVSRAFLGVRLDCVQCHDDMFGGRWKQRDFHRLAAFFAPAEMSLTGVRDSLDRGYEHRYLRKSEKERVEPQVPFQPELLSGEGGLRERLAGWVTHRENRAFARTTVNRVWALMFNRPLHAPIDEIPLEGELPPGMEILAEDLVAHRYDLRRLIRLIAATQAFRMESRSADPDHPVTEAQAKAFAAFPLTRLRPEQVAGSILQSANLTTINASSPVFVRMVRFFNQNDFVKRYGDVGEDEFDGLGGTIPQRLILMNGKLVHERTKEDLVFNAATRISAVAPDDATAIETAYLAVLSRRPTPEERHHFEGRRAEGMAAGGKKTAFMGDLYWTLINSTEFSWNH